MLLIGLAVGVDYSMFYLKREREERRKGSSERAALEAAAATSGRAVLVSGMTVMIAMAGMLFTGDKTFESFGVATMIVVGVAVLGSLTVLPALLSKLGDRVDKVRIPFLVAPAPRGRREPLLERRARTRCSSTRSSRRSSRPARCSRSPHLHCRCTRSRPGPETFPKSIPVMKVYDEMQDSFPGGSIPALVMVKVDNTSAENVRTRDREAAARRSRDGPVPRADLGERQPERDDRGRVTADRRHRHRRGVDARARDAARRRDPGDCRLARAMPTSASPACPPTRSTSTSR